MDKSIFLAENFERYNFCIRVVICHCHGIRRRCCCKEDELQQGINYFGTLERMCRALFLTKLFMIQYTRARDVLEPLRLITTPYCRRYHVIIIVGIVVLVNNNENLLFDVLIKTSARL